MINDESALRKHITKYVEDAGGHVSNIESHLTAAGIPDMNIFLHGTDIWLELKYKGRKMAMRPTQRRWHRTRAACGGMSWVLIYDPEDGGVWFILGHVVAEYPDIRQMPFDTITKHSLTSLGAILKSMAESEYNARGKKFGTPDRDGAQERPGSPGTPLSPGGEDVGGHHWLTSKP